MFFFFWRRRLWGRFRLTLLLKILSFESLRRDRNKCSQVRWIMWVLEWFQFQLFKIQHRLFWTIAEVCHVMQILYGLQNSFIKTDNVHYKRRFFSVRMYINICIWVRKFCPSNNGCFIWWTVFIYKCKTKKIFVNNFSQNSICKNAVLIK